MTPVGRSLRHRRRGGLRLRDLRGPHRGDLRRPLPVPGPDRGGRRPAGRARRPRSGPGAGHRNRATGHPAVRPRSPCMASTLPTPWWRSCGTSQAVRTSTSSSATSPPSPGIRRASSCTWPSTPSSPSSAKRTSSGASGEWPRLVPGGRFLLEAFVPDLARFDRGQRTSNSHVLTDGVVLEVSAHHPAGQRVDSAHVVISDRARGSTPCRSATAGRASWTSWPAGRPHARGPLGGLAAVPLHRRQRRPRVGVATPMTTSGRPRQGPDRRRRAERNDVRWLAADAAVERIDLDDSSG